jgi:Ni/Co efflux regulator RcnB
MNWNDVLLESLNRRHTMSKNIILCALVAAALGGTAVASAQDRGYQNDRGDRTYQQRDNRDSRWQDQRGSDRDSRWDDRRDRHDSRYGARGGYGRTADFNAGYDGAGPYHDLRRGARLPSRYRNHQYVVDNWRSHRLSAPPRGYHWVQTGADYVLVGIATGLIADMIINH